MHKDDAHAGQAVYSPFVLTLYDMGVLGLSCRWLWRCPASILLAHYQQNISDNHLDVGVGSGYFLDKVNFPALNPRVALMDLNPNSLDFCSRRIDRYQPQNLQRNVLEPIDYQGDKFDSLGMNLLLHCLPGTMLEKACAFDHLLPLLNPGARVFGATILQGDVPRNLAARGAMKVYNRKGIFSNQNDSLASLKQALESRLDQVDVQVKGYMALFSGSRP
ncbi:MAG: methyltransferase type 12 [Alcanivorax sp.]|uniref:class I SAM-dependent methyltransferase n=1 Tax=Alcanivorax sp. TaxID=1872427 RepID=UPI000C4FEF66|nr:class I SAM-dependent methyltransferase [Alcanivorax sp.]MBB10518.1 methyltransferase type 12 [Alcanivorax sp.]MBU83583.1 methyltransferase type 12 [Alcanivorax sp.]